MFLKLILPNMRSGLLHVRCVELGHSIDEDTTRRMAELEVWGCLRAVSGRRGCGSDPSPAARLKQLTMVARTDRAYEMAQCRGIKTAWGTDTLFDARLATRQGAQLGKMSRWYGCYRGVANGHER